jgi:hypothetical protein
MVVLRLSRRAGVIVGEADRGGTGPARPAGRVGSVVSAAPRPGHPRAPGGPRPGPLLPPARLLLCLSSPARTNEGLAAEVDSTNPKGASCGSALLKNIPLGLVLNPFAPRPGTSGVDLSTRHADARAPSAQAPLERFSAIWCLLVRTASPGLHAVSVPLFAVFACRARFSASWSWKGIVDGRKSRNSSVSKKLADRSWAVSTRALLRPDGTARQGRSSAPRQRLGHRSVGVPEPPHALMPADAAPAPAPARCPCPLHSV